MRVKPLVMAVTVHPRSRGEHGTYGRPAGSRAGSSPLPRGTSDCLVLRDADHRFIPAPAGNISSKPSTTGNTAVHPRSRGEHHIPEGTDTVTFGSSPLPRGTYEHREGVLEVVRFIPAPAGNISRSPPSQTPRTVHPRSRGEHFISPGRQIWYTGSSPLPRGTLFPKT